MNLATRLTTLPHGMEPLWDLRVRMAAFEFLAKRGAATDDVFSREELLAGFEIDGQRVPFVSPQGIFTPRVLNRPLSILTVAPRLNEPPPYEDGFTYDGLLLYRYRGTDPDHSDNVGLRNCMIERLPLIYFYGLVKGRYLAVWPVYLVDEDRKGHAFRGSVDEKPVVLQAGPSVLREGDRSAERRCYKTVETKQRLHQRGFRERVLSAYRGCCAVCRLRHEELLEAAHIVADGLPKGDPVIPNGIALCKLHHAAFDRHILGITPDYKLHVREDILREHDGPMLRVGLQEVHGHAIHVPRPSEFRPDRDRLDIRYADFLKAG